MSEQRLLTVPEVARYLSLSRSQVYLLISTGALPSVRIGRLRRIDLGALDAYVDRLADNGSGPQHQHGGRDPMNHPDDLSRRSEGSI